MADETTQCEAKLVVKQGDCGTTSQRGHGHGANDIGERALQHFSYAAAKYKTKPTEMEAQLKSRMPEPKEIMSNNILIEKITAAVKICFNIRISKKNH